MKSIDVLETAFKRLSKRQRTNLKVHLERKTPIFCGERADMDFYSKEGYG